MILVVCTLMLCGTQLMAQDSNSAALDESGLRKLLIPKGPAKTFQQHLAKTQVSDAVLRELETMPDPGPIFHRDFGQDGIHRRGRYR
jgi:hypothetical protein